MQVADNATFSKNVQILFNNDYENIAGLGAGTNKQYFESNEGKLVDAKGIKTRYLRFCSNGSNNDLLNGYVEVGVYGLPVK